jgi:predicted transcriptional regulator
MQTTVQEVMAKRPVTIDQHASIDEALDLLLQEAVSELYVTGDSGRLVGVVPDYELLKAQLAQVACSTAVETLMSRSFVTTDPRCLLSALAPIFRESYCRRIAVVDNGQLVGQIDRRHVIASLRNGQSVSTADSLAASCTPAARPLQPAECEDTATHRPLFSERKTARRASELAATK